MKKSKFKTGNFSLAHVLWYAFTEVDGDCFMSKVEAEEALAHAQAQAHEGAKKENINSAFRKRRAA